MALRKMWNYFAGEVGEVLRLFAREEVEAEEVGGNEEDVGKDERTNDMLFTCDGAHQPAVCSGHPGCWERLHGKHSISLTTNSGFPPFQPPLGQVRVFPEMSVYKFGKFEAKRSLCFSLSQHRQFLPSFSPLLPPLTNCVPPSPPFHRVPPEAGEYLRDECNEDDHRPETNQQHTEKLVQRIVTIPGKRCPSKLHNHNHVGVVWEGQKGREKVKVHKAHKKATYHFKNYPVRPQDIFFTRFQS